MSNVIRRHFCFDWFALLHALLHAKRTIQWLYSTLDSIWVKWSIYLTSCDPESSNQMTILLNDVIYSSLLSWVFCIVTDSQSPQSPKFQVPSPPSFQVASPAGSDGGVGSFTLPVYVFLSLFYQIFSPSLPNSPSLFSLSFFLIH